MIPKDLPVIIDNDSLETVEDGFAAFLEANFLLTLVMGTSLNMLWSILNVLQLIVKLPLLQISVPASADLFNMPMLTIATFDLLDRLELQSQMFVFPEVEPYTPQLELSGYESIYFSLNIGSLYFILLFLVFYVIFGALIRFCLSRIKSHKKLKKKIKEKINVENFTLRTMIEGYYEFILCLAINYKMIELSYGEYSILGVN